MRKLMMQMELTLDGFYGGPQGEMDWFTLDPDAWRLRNSYFRDRIDTVLLGRKNYEGFYGYWPNVAGNPDASKTDVAFSKWLDEVPKVVFSRTLEKTEWQNSSLAGSDFQEELPKLKAQSGQNILIMSSASVAQACAEHGLIDEYWLTLHPVAIGEGLSFFEDRVALELLESKTFDSGQVFLRYTTKGEG